MAFAVTLLAVLFVIGTYAKYRYSNRQSTHPVRHPKLYDEPRPASVPTLH
jgi:hypothetical protein